MNNHTVTIPVQATMHRRADGRFEMVEAEYMTVDASMVAVFIAERLGLAVKDENERHDLQQVVNT